MFVFCIVGSRYYVSSVYGVVCCFWSVSSIENQSTKTVGDVIRAATDDAGTTGGPETPESGSGCT